jgi:hypothetical protein
MNRLYALYENSRLSTREIEPFIRKYHINMAEFEPVRYRSFAEFFDRRFRPSVRKFPSVPDEMGAFAEARYFGLRIRPPPQVAAMSLSGASIFFRREGRVCPSGHIAKCSNEKCQNIPGRCLRNVREVDRDIRGPVPCVGRVSMIEVRRGAAPAIVVCCKLSRSAR